MNGGVDSDSAVSFSATAMASGEIDRVPTPSRPASSPRERATDPGFASDGSAPITVLTIVSDEATRELLPRVVTADHLYITSDLSEALALAQSNPPDAAFVEIGSGAGLAMVHHLKAVTPAVTIFALASRNGLDAAANAVALGGAGLLMMPVGGDEILSAIESVKMRLAEHAFRGELEQAARLAARAAGWMGRVAELADSPSRISAAELLGAVLCEATGASSAAVYLAADGRPTELTRVAATPDLETAPAFAMEAEVLDHARRERLLVVPLATRTLKVGHALLAAPSSAPPSSLGDAAPRAARVADGLVKLLATQGATALAFLGERERGVGAPVKDPGSSAYSFAYYVDVAGREIDKARTYGRRFAIVTVAFDPIDDVTGAVMRPPEIADQILLCARDIDVLARVDEHELHLLMPEADGLTAHACRRRILARFAEKGPRALPRGLLVGAATFPHDGRDLSQLLRVARRRAEATRSSIVHRLGEGTVKIADLLETLEWEAGTPPLEDLGAPRPISLSVVDLAALAAAVTADALRGGAVLITVAHHAGLCLGAAVRAALTPLRDNVTVHTLDVRSSGGDDIEALSIIAEHACYALIGRSQGGVVKGLHAADPLLADALAERLGRAAGLRIFA
ncbi:MAG: response regulator [Byssovorax sp.]